MTIIQPTVRPLSTRMGPDGKPDPRLLTDSDMLTVDPQMLLAGGVRGIDLYRKTDSYYLYVESDKPFTDADYQKLIGQPAKEVFILYRDKAKYFRFAESHILSRICLDNSPVEKRAENLYNLATIIIEDLLSDPKSLVTVNRAIRLASHVRDFITEADGSLHALVTLSRFEPYLHTHSINVCVLGTALGYMMGYVEDSLENLSIGCLLHDIGKRAVPAKTLNKKSALSKEEWNLIRMHPELGCEMIRQADADLDDEVYSCILTHHERIDGSGYPKGLSGKQIHPFGQIAGLVDAFDAMTTDRVYAKAVNSFPALKTIKSEMLSQFDPEIFRRFVLVLQS